VNEPRAKLPPAEPPTSPERAHNRWLTRRREDLCRTAKCGQCLTAIQIPMPAETQPVRRFPAQSAEVPIDIVLG
jgi:hypothetical protein